MTTLCQRAAVYLFHVAALVSAQQVGTITKEAGPVVTIKHCTKAGGCKEEQNTLTLDANWRWVHSTKGSDNCYTDGAWDEELCPDPETCAKKCALDGVDADSYESTYGISKISGGVKLQYVTKGEYGDNVGSRLYMLDGTDTYKMFKLKNREFTFDVEGSTLACGLNGALYLVEMKEDGGLGGHNKAGAKYGTGYCDAQCPHDVKFMGGKANVQEWDRKTAFGKLGHCCTELDLWEANMADTAFTPHPCDVEGPLVCQGTKCGDLKTHERYKGVCDKDGCDFNTFRMGNQSFYGPGPKFTVDSSKPVTVVTRFVTEDGTDEGALTEMRRYYVQDGKVIPNAVSTVDGVEGDAVSADFCQAQKKVFKDPDDFSKKGGMRKMGKAMDRGMVLVLSLWDDAATDMAWLDATAPLDSHRPGARRGPCAESSGKPKDLRSRHSAASVSYYNFRYGEIGSTVHSISDTKPSTPASSSSSSPARSAGGSSSHSSSSSSSSSGRSSSSSSSASGGSSGSPSSRSTSSASGISSPVSTTTSSSSSSNIIEESFCCLAGAGQSDRCHSCLASGRVGMESWCGRSRFNCQQCTALAKWCQATGQDDDKDRSDSDDDDSEEDAESPSEVVSDRTSDDAEDDEDTDEADPLFPRKNSVHSPLATFRGHLPAAVVALLAVGFVGVFAAVVASVRTRPASRRTVLGQLYAELGAAAQAAALRGGGGGAGDEPQATQHDATYL